MTLNSVIALILRFLPNSIALLANYVTVVEGRPIIRAVLSNGPAGPGPRAPKAQGPPNSACIIFYLVK